MGIVLQGTVVTATNMKLLIVLALVGLVYGDAKPQWLLPGVTLKTAEGDTPSIYTATYGHAGLPLTYGGILPYSGFYNGLHPYSGLFPYSGLSPFHYPLVTVAKPAEEGAAVEAARKKRDADPEPEADAEADPQLLLSSGLHYPAAVTTYASPATYTLPTTYTLPSYSHGILPYSGLYNGLHPYSGLFPYSGLHPFGLNPFLSLAKPAEEEPAVEAARKKRSAEPEAEAEPEADPQLLLSTGLHTPYTLPLTTGLTGLPLHTPYTYPLSYSSPLTYSTAYHPISYTYPLGTSYGFGGYPLLSTLAAAKE